MSWPGSNPISREINDFWQESAALWQQWQYEADLDIKMATGQQDYWNGMMGNTNQKNQRQLQFNKILRIINMIGGYQRDNRLATVVSPADNDLDNGQTADQLTKVLSWIMRQDHTYEKISDCFDGSNMCGLNLLECWMDFREDPENGEIKTTRLPFSSFIMSPYWEKMDLSDCDRILTRKYMSARQLESLMPDLKKEIPSLGKGYVSKDGKFQYLAQNWYQYNQQLYAYDEYWIKETKKTRKLLDKATGEVAEWKGTKDQFQMLRRFNPNVELISANVPTIKQYILVNNNLVFEEKSPYGLNRFPHVPFVGYHFTEVQNYAYRYQGVVRNIRDSQVELNKRRNRLLDILDAQVQSGLMVKEDALVNPEDAFFQGPGKVMYFKQSANLATDVVPFQAPPVGAGWLELIQTIEKEIMDIVGPEELFAQNLGAKEMSGVLMKLKMGAGLTGLRNIFDRLNESQMSVGDIMQTMVQENFEIGKISKIIGEEPTQQFKQAFNTKYHCITEEAEMTSTQRQLQFLQALQLKQLGIPISTRYLLEKSTLQGKKELIEDIEKQEQLQQQMQHAQAMHEMEQSAMLSRSLEAKAQSDFAGAEEKRARSVSDFALAKERASQAVADRARGALDNVKAIKEIHGMDNERLINLGNFILDMQDRQRAISGGEESDSEGGASANTSSIKEAEIKTRPSNLQSAINQ